MGLVDTANLGDYAAILRSSTNEVGALANDLMINVTGFFRDPEAWEALRAGVIAPLVASKQEGQTIRCWVTACASGEEAYTLAMLLAEELTGREHIDVKIFATDTADRSLALARAGVYPGGIEADLTPERLDRFFDKDEHAYRVKKEMRDMVVFAPQDLLRDPPFSRIDICTCRNLLIYLEPETQRRVLSLLHFALRDGAYLFLGNTESFNGSEHLFEVISKKWRIYRRTGSAQLRFASVTESPNAAASRRNRALRGIACRIPMRRVPPPRCSSSARCSSTTARPPWSSIAPIASSISMAPRRVSRSAGRRADARPAAAAARAASRAGAHRAAHRHARQHRRHRAVPRSTRRAIARSRSLPRRSSHSKAPDYYRVSFAAAADGRAVAWRPTIVVRETGAQ